MSSPDYLGCGNSGCIVDKPTGMRPSGGCQCFADIPSDYRHRVRQGVMRMRVKLDAATMEIARLQAALEKANA